MNYPENPPFSLIQYYKRNRAAARIDAALAALLILLILYAPLPFGSVQYSSIAVLEAGASLAFILWMVKLLYCGNPDELAHFRKIQRTQTEEIKVRPFFDRHPWFAGVSRVATLGKWPRRYEAGDLVAETPDHPDDDISHPRRFHSF